MTENITIEMLTRSGYAQRHGICNFPDVHERENLLYLAKNVLQPIYDRHNIHVYITSGYRNQQVNAGVGGSKYSLHRIGAAADLDSVVIPKMEILSFIYKNLPFTELIAEYFPDGWVHVGIIKGREEERKLKLKDSNHNFDIIDFEYLQKIYGRAA